MLVNSDGDASARQNAAKFGIRRSSVRRRFPAQGVANVRGGGIHDGVEVQRLESHVEGGAKRVCRRYEPSPM